MPVLCQEVIGAQQHLQRALEYLRKRRDDTSNGEEKRRLSVAITDIETGSMWMNMSQFAHEAYTPIISRQI